MDNYGLAIEDSDKAIAIDPTYAKAYYRKADANIFLDKYKEA
jgi:serine/threonine-protein phosphatase 5